MKILYTYVLYATEEDLKADYPNVENPIAVVLLDDIKKVGGARR